MINLTYTFLDSQTIIHKVTFEYWYMSFNLSIYIDTLMIFFLFFSMRIGHSSEVGDLLLR